MFYLLILLLVGFVVVFWVTCRMWFTLWVAVYLLVFECRGLCFVVLI